MSHRGGVLWRCPVCWQQDTRLYLPLRVLWGHLRDAHGVDQQPGW